MIFPHDAVMCCTFRQREETKRPRHRVRVKGPEGAENLVWAGFARTEIRAWWERSKQAVPVDIEAESFAERAEDNGELVWDEVPDGFVLRGLRVPSGSESILKIVTRAATPKELEHFRHPRMPVCEEPLYKKAES